MQVVTAVPELHLSGIEVVLLLALLLFGNEVLLAHVRDG
jgi:hypothetical protein